MLAKLYSVALEGIEGIICEVEVDVARGGFDKTLIVGLPDAAVKESVGSVRSAIVNCGYKYPKTQSLVNLAPADTKKEGPAFDLPIALGILLGEPVFSSTCFKGLCYRGRIGTRRQGEACKRRFEYGDDSQSCGFSRGNRSIG